jgi:hypothetical protein
MTQLLIDIGTTANDGTGDPLRTAFAKINNNFTQLFGTGFQTYEVYTMGLDPSQIIYETSANTFTQGLFQIRSSDPDNTESQDIMLQAQITNNLAGVRFTAYGTSFEGNAVCSYDMDVFGGNVRILVNPIKDATLFHFISAQVTSTGPSVPGIPIGLDGYPENYDLGTEDGLVLTTEN